ncbi:hypothetical protein OYT1_ch2280 [Ferriphaselus amnicola]|uniref:Sulfate transporter n=2 Tax=Ferriphaselus amnicola TaxID=1188319 RepID=A0A2Z6GDZ4_9PROT|nr:hypothetical protein OYT1_ch2280 [Ferriphaselus amnicola]
MNTTEIKPIPEGYMQDAKGALWPKDTVREIDLLRDDLVREIVSRAKAQSEALAQFKAGVFGDIESFIQLSGEKYGVKMGGIKGNVSLLSFDGRYKVQRAVAESLAFDERLQVAKELIDQCIHEWSQGSRSEIRALINDAFQVDKEGRVNSARILSLRRLDIADEKWNKAMQAIGESIQVAGSKTYFRVYERVGDTDQYRPISLDIAAV